MSTTQDHKAIKYFPGEREFVWTETDRYRYLSGFASQLPAHLAFRFIAEAEARPDEWPIISRDVNETYPDATNWQSRTRCYEPGILHWQWADGGGFPPSDSEKQARASAQEEAVSDGRVEP